MTTITTPILIATRIIKRSRPIRSITRAMSQIVIAIQIPKIKFTTRIITTTLTITTHMANIIIVIRIRTTPTMPIVRLTISIIITIVTTNATRVITITIQNRFQQ